MSEVAHAIGTDSRIGPKFLQASVGQYEPLSNVIYDIRHLFILAKFDMSTLIVRLHISKQSILI